MLLHEMYKMENFLKQVNLVTSIIITKNKLTKISTSKTLYLYYTENGKRVDDIC